MCLARDQLLPVRCEREKYLARRPFLIAPSARAERAPPAGAAGGASPHVGWPHGERRPRRSPKTGRRRALLRGRGMSARSLARSWRLAP